MGGPRVHRRAMLIHQVWWQGWEKIPTRLHSQIQSVWGAFGPQIASGEVRFVRWDGAAITRLIRSLGGDFARAFDACERIIERCDIGRLAILHKFGGLYLDLDVTATRSGSAILAGLSDAAPHTAYCSAGSYISGAARVGVAVAEWLGFPGYANSIMFVARPGHPLWATTAAKSVQMRRHADWVRLRQFAPNQFVCAVTGPVLLSLAARGAARVEGRAFSGLVHNYDSGW